MNRLRNRLMAVFLLATLLPLGLTLWTAARLLESSLLLAPISELDAVSRSLERTGRELYQQSRESLKRDAVERRIQPRSATPEEAQAFLDRGTDEQFELAGERGNRLDYYVRRGSQVLIYSRPMGVFMEDLQHEYAGAREAIETTGTRDFRRGFRGTLLVVAAALWFAAFAALLYLAARITRPVQQLTQGLGRVAAGDLTVRLPAEGDDEIGAAARAFNHMAQALEQSRERLVHVTRLASWQALARKMAHEVKNSLTPIRLTMEEVASRCGGDAGGPDGAFLEQAAQIVVDEVQTLERRVRAFSEFATEPPVALEDVDLGALLEERVALLKAAHPGVCYEIHHSPPPLLATADSDLVKGIVTNLLENAAQAAGASGKVSARIDTEGDRVYVEIHDSGPGLTPQSRSTLFEPSISFKKGGMGLGLSIAKKSALLCGGDLQVVEGTLGGAAFRLTLPPSQESESNIAAETRIAPAPLSPFAAFALRTHDSA